MNFLALDTSSDACSVALQIGDDVFERHVVQPKEHTNLLISMIRDVRDEAGITLESLDAIVLGNGPGSFIGMRIAASVAQGLAFGSGLKIAPVSSMAAVAAEVMHTHSATDVVVAQDARMNEVYLGIYRSDADSLPVAVSDELIQTIDAISELSESSTSEIHAAGYGWKKYPSLLELNRTALSQFVDVYYPNAKYLLSLGARACSNGELVDPENLLPAYIRMKVAEKPREAGRVLSKTE
jgi:tRNA threonylcarbamoyladenosine biosynthesis protein TsaB